MIAAAISGGAAIALVLGLAWRQSASPVGGVIVLTIGQTLAMVALFCWLS